MDRDLLKVADRHWARTQERALQWGHGREALRQLCATPHSDLNATVSKLWLIGRSHSASLDRTHVGWQPMVYEKTAAKLATIGLDRKLRAIRACGEAYGRKHVALIEATVHEATAVLSKTTQQWKISLATKYLHYHAPSVPIFDSISRQVYARFTGHGHKDEVETRRDAYGRHLARFLTIRSRLIAHGVKSVNARMLDDFAMNL
jgi:hypothetical protein